MGEIRVKLEVIGKKGSKLIEAIVDSGAQYTSITKEIAEEIGLEPQTEDRLETADGKEEIYKIGFGEVSLAGCRKPAMIVILEGHNENLLGYPELQKYHAKIDEDSDKVTFTCGPGRL